jgi:FKBP-type peptidyl-prolyl cis-trans isomerase FkpA
MKQIFSILVLSSLCIGALAQKKVVKKTTNTPTKSTKNNNTGFTPVNGVLSYKIIPTGSGPLIQPKEFVRLHMKQMCGDSAIMSTYKSPNGPEINRIESQGPQDAMTNLILKLRIGDSLVVKYNTDSIFKNNAPPYYKKGDEAKMCLKVVSRVSARESDSLIAFQAEMMQKQQAEQQKAEADSKISESTLIPAQEKEIEAYCVKNNIKFKKTESGLYYSILAPGTEPKMQAGKTVSVNYTGQTLDGKKFDSNIEPAFNHVQAFEFPLGAGRVIKGWDEAIQLLGKGGKAILLIPSRLAYGARGAGKDIGPNAVLRFDVEAVDSK